MNIKKSYIKKLRKGLPLTTYEIAAWLNVSRATIHNMETPEEDNADIIWYYALSHLATVCEKEGRTKKRNVRIPRTMEVKPVL